MSIQHHFRVHNLSEEYCLNSKLIGSSSVKHNHPYMPVKMIND